MRIYFVFIIIIFLGCTQKRQESTNSEITKIKLQLEDHLRIPFHWVWVTIEKKPDSIMVHSVSKPLVDSLKWEYSRIDTSFALTLTAYNKLVSLVTQITASDLKYSSVQLDDGTDVTISYGNSKSEQTFNVSTPSYEAEKRKTQQILDASIEILKISRIPFK